MIIVKIQGGLGNQMFQYALGRNLSLIHKTAFKIDPSYLRRENQSGRSFQLHNFNTILEEASPKEIQKYRGTFQKILDKIRPDLKKLKISDIGKNLMAFEANILNRKDGYFDGHWNNERYFKANEETIKKDFTLKSPLGTGAAEILRMIESEPNATSLHIRRGDYLSIQKVSNIYNQLPFSYYQKAMEYMLARHPDTHFFVSSDDIEWVKENFPQGYPVTFVSSPLITEYEELVLMTQCKHNTIANSTYSWWGAYLNKNDNKIVIAPEHWFLDATKNNNDFVPKTWIRM
jgi:hypothetical protein